MTTQTEAMKMALEALEYSKDSDHPHYEDQIKAITALREALAEQPAQPLTDEENSKLFDSLIDEMLEHSYQGSHDSAEKVANELRRVYKAAHGITKGNT